MPAGDRDPRLACQGSRDALPRGLTLNIKGDNRSPESAPSRSRRFLLRPHGSVGLNPEHILDEYPHQLSGGQLQRFLVARALLLGIEFLVADEIISMLDASTRTDLLNLLADLRASGLSVLFITHALSLGYYISERAVILYKGSVGSWASAQRIYSKLLHPHTQMLMASVPCLDKKWEEVQVELAAKYTDFADACVCYEKCPVADKELGCDRRRPHSLRSKPIIL